jgi:hypothetical protein
MAEDKLERERQEGGRESGAGPLLSRGSESARGLPGSGARLTEGSRPGEPTVTPGGMDPGPAKSRKDAEQPGEAPSREGRLPAASEAESVELGIGKDFVEVDEQGAPSVPARLHPRGLLPVPSEVEAIVAKEEARLWEAHGIIPTSEARQRMVDSLTLQYYFDGIDIADRRSAQGVEVLAVGLEELGALIRSVPQDQREGVVFGQG